MLPLVILALVHGTSGTNEVSQFLRGSDRSTNENATNTEIIASNSTQSSQNVTMLTPEVSGSEKDSQVLNSTNGGLGENISSNASLSSAWGWHHGILGETCCMCQVRTGRVTLLYSAEDYHHWYGGHSAQWRCLHECPRKCNSNWHHGNYFGCFDESHLYAMDQRYGHASGYQISYGHFGSIC